MGTKTLAIVAANLLLLAASLAGCAGAEDKQSGPDLGSQAWPVATQEHLPLGAAQSEVGLGEAQSGGVGIDGAVPMDDFYRPEGLCESVVEPALAVYFDDDLDEAVWRETLEPVVAPHLAAVLDTRPPTQTVLTVTEMPSGDGDEGPVWCEVTTSVGMWLVGVTWPDDVARIMHLQFR